jgi:hypothetical protein
MLQSARRRTTLSPKYRDDTYVPGKGMCLLLTIHDIPEAVQLYEVRSAEGRSVCPQRLQSVGTYPKRKDGKADI